VETLVWRRDKGIEAIREQVVAARKRLRLNAWIVDEMVECEELFEPEEVVDVCRKASV